MAANPTQPPLPMIEQLILEVRGQEAMLDQDLAGLYEVMTGALNQAVGRNKRRFPADFAFRLSSEEHAALRSQNVMARPVGSGVRAATGKGELHGACRRFRPSGRPLTYSANGLD